MSNPGTLPQSKIGSLTALGKKSREQVRQKKILATLKIWGRASMEQRSAAALSYTHKSMLVHSHYTIVVGASVYDLGRNGSAHVFEMSGQQSA